MAELELMRMASPVAGRTPPTQLVAVFQFKGPAPEVVDADEAA
jgi:hypothetical protein